MAFVLFCFSQLQSKLSTKQKLRMVQSGNTTCFCVGEFLSALLFTHYRGKGSSLPFSLRTLGLQDLSYPQLKLSIVI